MPLSVVIPALVYPDVREAVAWLCDSFGFVERLRIGAHRAQLSIGEGDLVVAEMRRDSGASSSEASGAHSLQAAWFGHPVMARVADVDGHYERARRSGARIVSPPTDYPYGERQYTAEDLGGHQWTFSQTIADVDPKTWGGQLF
jgi:uncharacterized glyoxalase superfamily protein PhnB